MNNRRQFGDFQTPPELAGQLCTLLARRGVRPQVVIEPTCGTGSFVNAAAHTFRDAHIVGMDINTEHLSKARNSAAAAGFKERVDLVEANIFDVDWEQVLRSPSDQVLVVGNPPWVTSADIGRAGGDNLPQKTNIKKMAGLDAITGASNFDISEWMLITLLQGLQERRATVAMLCKTSVARRIVEYAASRNLDFRCEGMWNIKAEQVWGASVAAGFFIFHTGKEQGPYICPTFKSTKGEDRADEAFGIDEGRLVADVPLHRRWRSLGGADGFAWRSGIKHDCAKVMELRQVGEGRYINGLGEELSLEPDYLYPLVKGTDIRRRRSATELRSVLVTQQKVGEETSSIAQKAPLTWKYLWRHRSRLARRASTVYNGQPEFAIFGIGPYSCSQFKVFTSGLAKEPQFICFGPVNGKPVMADDTCYFLGFDEEPYAHATLALLSSTPAQEFLRSLVFSDAKRPVTKRVLEQLHLGRMARWALDNDRALSDKHGDTLEKLSALGDV